MPRLITGLSNRLGHIKKAKRLEVDFRNELDSLAVHAGILEQKRVEELVREIYLPKLKVKFNSPYVYAGENSGNYRRLDRFQTVNHLFSDGQRDPQKVILGIESSFDESAACLVNSFGKIMSGNIRFTQPEMAKDFNGGVDPMEAQKHHKEYLPKAVDQALDGCELDQIEAIAVTLGPGQIGSLGVGLDVAMVS